MEGPLRATDQTTAGGTLFISSVTVRCFFVLGATALLALGIGKLQLSIWVELVLSSGLAAAFAWRVGRSLHRPMRSAAEIANTIANGELGQRIALTRRDEFGELFIALHAMAAKLNEIVGGVRVSANAAGLAARQLADGSAQLNERTQEQAAALEQTAASVEQLTATVKQNAEHASQAHELGSNVAQRAESGAAVVRKAIAAMVEIKQASERIADIIGVIDEIAFQTNLLALNASVEAARAGEQGRGFAVVAAEVRALAQRSAAAAKQIKDLIGGSVEKMQVGAELVVRSGEGLFAITNDVKRVTAILADIAAANGEQAAGIMQVSDAIMRLDSVTQQNAVLAEETSHASKVMEQQSTALIQQIGFFRRASGTDASSPSQLIEEILIHQRENARLVMNAVIARDAEVTRGAAANIKHNRDCIAALWQQYRPTVANSEEQAMADSYWNLRIQFIGTIEEAIRLLEAGSPESAQQLVMARLSEVSRPMFTQGEALKSWLEGGALDGRAPMRSVQAGSSITSWARSA
jgi:methyl-accepting chemotaxis protein